MIAKDGSEWLQIDLGSVHAITTSETQGRFGNGQGVEFSESYMLEYFRPRLGKWVRYRSREGEDVIKGNSNTYLAVKNELNPVILASKIRFHPYSHFKRTVCMRVEVYGCSWDGKNIILRDDWMFWWPIFTPPPPHSAVAFSLWGCPGLFREWNRGHSYSSRAIGYSIFDQASLPLSFQTASFLIACRRETNAGRPTSSTTGPTTESGRETRCTTDSDVSSTETTRQKTLNSPTMHKVCSEMNFFFCQQWQRISLPKKRKKVSSSELEKKGIRYEMTWLGEKWAPLAACLSRQPS